MSRPALATHDHCTLIVKVGDNGPDPQARDGDIINSMPRLQCRSVHAQHIYHFRNAPRNSNGLITPDSVYVRCAEESCEWKFERISQTETRKTSLITGNQSIVGPTPNADGDAMDVELFLLRRRANPKNFIIGSPGREIWYGGTRPINHDVLDNVWDKIEEHTVHRESTFSLWPAGEKEKRLHLLVHVEDITQSRSKELEETDKDGTGEVVTYRKNSLAWRDLSGIDVTKTEDKNALYDPRLSLAKVNIEDVVIDKLANR